MTRRDKLLALNATPESLEARFDSIEAVVATAENTTETVTEETDAAGNAGLAEETDAAEDAGAVKEEKKARKKHVTKASDDVTEENEHAADSVPQPKYVYLTIRLSNLARTYIKYVAVTNGIRMRDAFNQHFRNLMVETEISQTYDVWTAVPLGRKNDMRNYTTLVEEDVCGFIKKQASLRLLSLAQYVDSELCAAAEEQKKKMGK